MSHFIDAKVKITALVELLRNSGGFQIEATFGASLVENALSRPDTSIDISGRDLPILLQNDEELLQAIKHVAGRILRLTPAEAAVFRFDAAHASPDKTSELERLATAGIEIVRATCRPHRFPPMLPSERRLLHLSLASSGLKSANTGYGLKRAVILYPQDMEPPLEQTPGPDGSEPSKSRYTAA